MHSACTLAVTMNRNRNTRAEHKPDMAAGKNMSTNAIKSETTPTKARMAEPVGHLPNPAPDTDEKPRRREPEDSMRAIERAAEAAAIRAAEEAMMAMAEASTRIARLGEQAFKTKFVGVLTPPAEASRAAHDSWVQENLAHVEGRVQILPLTGTGRTLEAVSDDIAMVVHGARHQVTVSARLPELDDDAGKEAVFEWIKQNGAQGTIKMTGEGRTLQLLRAEARLYKLGADAVETDLVGVLVQPERTRAAHDSWVKANLDHVEGRATFLPLTGTGRTVEAVADDIARAIEGAKSVLKKA